MKQLTENIDCVEKVVPSDVWNRFIDWTGKLFINRYEPPHDKTNNVAMRPAKTQISLGIRPV